MLGQVVETAHIECGTHRMNYDSGGHMQLAADHVQHWWYCQAVVLN
jgi:hypothetical protein